MLSQLSNNFVSDPNQVVKLQQKVTVTVTEVDVARKRIALTMKDVIQKQSDKKPFIKREPQKQATPSNPFQDKLMELKKKFKN